jgi:pyruvate dehydrogenase E1 component alpha subunit
VGLFGAPGVIGLVWLNQTGAAWAFKVKKSGQVSVVVTGDGSVASRYAYPAVRSAANYKLPVVYVISNNFQGVSNPIAAMSPAAYVADYFAGLGLPCSIGDGNNIAQTYAMTKEAADRARAGDGPSVLELLTFRWYDHSGFAGAKIGQDAAWGLPYRTDDEVKAWMSRDPIVRAEAFLKERGLLTQAELDANKAKARKDVDDAVDFARASPFPRPEDGAKQVWYGGVVVPATQFFEHKVIV